ncbi:MAG TPA: thioredoxin domain-containing protein [Chryseolinea sp.]
MKVLIVTTVVLQFLLLIGCSSRVENAGRSLNRLADAGSPYLREHADNPVDWYEWGPEALAKAKAENKPLIISIGYASCHWCHVMERESFMDTAVARIMNENFVSIKIDREERPDIDQIYLEAAQLISGNGGWPLNALALPDGKPFYAATYFPKDQWINLLKQAIQIYREDHANVVKQADALTKGIQSDELFASQSAAIEVDRKAYENVFTSWETSLDPKWGGISDAPKFPMPAVGEFLLQYHHLTKNEKALRLATASLDAMANGGIFDHLGGGFARYSTDAIWHVPHFEKMLYDNAQLVSLYAHGYQVAKNPQYADVIHKTLGFIKREMTSPDGGFYSSLNADSEGEEGKFYVWTKEEIEQIIGQKASDLFIPYYQITDSGNWEEGKNVLFRKMSKEKLAEVKGVSLDECTRLLNDAESLLLKARDQRERPTLDDKILLSWNALMLRGYIDAYYALGNSEYLETAMTNARFIEKNFIRPNGELWRSFNNGKANIEAFLDDYVLLARSYISLYQATYDIHWLEQARLFTDYAVNNFANDQSALFFYTSNKAENLVARKMEVADNVIPASNSVLAEVLYLLGEYFADNSYLEKSKSMLSQVVPQIAANGPYYSNWASLMGLTTTGPYEVAVMGKEAIVKSNEIRKSYYPTALFMGGEKENLPLLENKNVEGRTIIYVCRNKVCKLPEEDVQKAIKQLR